MREISMSQQLTEQKSSQWVYTTIRLHDGQRVLYPTHVSSDRIIFHAPPKLAATQVEVTIRSGDHEVRSWVEVLPHDANATEIPVRIITTPAL
jgi:hypothetical protein